MAELQSIGTMRRAQYTLEVSTVNVAKGRTEALSVGLS